MRAIQVTRLDGPRSVEVCQLEPPAADGQVSIEVHAAGVTFPEVLLTRGAYQLKPALPFVPGSEVAGIVKSAPGDSAFRPGDRVASFCAFGGFAEEVVVDPKFVFPLPERLSFAQGAALPMNVLTAHFALLQRGHLKAGETVLVQGAGGGLGSAAVQLARALGAKVIAVVSTPEKRELAKRAGADEVVMADGFRNAVAALTGGRGVDMVVDPVGGERFTDSLRTLASEGRLLVLGFTGGEIPTVKVNRLLLNNIDVVGASWGTFFMRHPGSVQLQWADLLPHLESGALDPLISAELPLEEAGEAIASLEERRALGKVVLAVRRP
jgi:NADPH2:quinone reductase